MENKENEYTVKKWTIFWLTNVKINLKGNTRDSYYSSFVYHINPVLGDIQLKNLTLLEIQRCINIVMNKKVKGKNGVQSLSGKTVREIFLPFKQALQYAMDENLMPYINLKRLELPRVKKGTREIRSEREAKIISDYFANRIISKPFDLYYAPIAVIDARGLRPEECAGLRWEDINFEEDFFWIGRHTVVKNGIYDENGNKIGGKIVIEDSTKTPYGERKIPLGMYLRNIFKLKYKDSLEKGISCNPTDFVFLTKFGTPFYEQSLRSMYKSLARYLGIKELGCYSLRHEFATSLVKIKRCDQETILQLMGWKNVIGTYFHTNELYKRKILNCIDEQYKVGKLYFFISNLLYKCNTKFIYKKKCK